MNIQELIKKLVGKQNLTIKDSEFIANEMLKGNLSQSQISAILALLASKGESVDEIIGFIKAVRGRMVKVKDSSDAIDVCGTGGDGSGTFNISTAVAFVVSGCGVKVAKHGNRAASSKCGSADVLEELGGNINLKPLQVEEVLKKVGMVFLFAPNFHPAFKNVAAVRKELGIPTIFNYIGPFANPAGVKRQLIGVANLEIAKKLSEVARSLNYKRLFIAISEDGLDEISIFAKTVMFEISRARLTKHVIDPFSFRHSGERSDSRIDSGQVEDALGTRMTLIKGGLAKVNAQIIRKIISGKEKGPKRDIVVFNSAFALLVSGKVRTIEEGIRLAEESIDSGSALKILERIQEETNKYA